MLLDALPEGQPGGAIVYAATRKHAEDYAKDLGRMGIAAEYFHAGLSPEQKKDVQKRFVEGDLRVITATNAFGMGIDKPDVRLVVHADISGSLENYLQEAGRAGRDRAQARCVLLYTPEDVERQFGLSARSRLTRREIQAVLKAVRRLDRRKHQDGEVVATSGEILAAEENGAFERDSASDDTRVRTALSWLEEAHLLRREENRVSVFPSSLRVASLEEAERQLLKCSDAEYRKQLLKIVAALFAANADEGLSTDELMAVAGLSPEQTRRALHDLEALGIASNDTALTAFVHRGVERSSEKRLAEAAALEQNLIALLREAAPDLAPGGESVLHLRHSTQQLKDRGHAKVLPKQVWRLVKGLAGDGQGEAGGCGSLSAKKLDPETARVTLLQPWGALEETARRRREGAARLLQQLLACLPEGQRGSDLLAETTLGKLLSAHKAKGLEFDHVVVLDGDRSRRDSHEDVDAARRLYYVAMTRARRSLILARQERPHPLLDPLSNLPCLLRRPATALAEPTPEQARKYRRVYHSLSLKDVDIGYPGRQSPASPIHAAIVALQPGDPLTLYPEGRAICNGQGIQVGQLAKGYRPPAGMRCAQARVSAILVWQREQSDAEYQHLAKCERWEVVLPDLVFAPD